MNGDEDGVTGYVGSALFVDFCPAAGRPGNHCQTPGQPWTSQRRMAVLAVAEQRLFQRLLFALEM